MASWLSFRGDMHNTGVTAFDRSSSDNTPVSSLHLGGLIWGTPVVDENGMVYVGSTNKRFYAINSKNKTVMWEFKISNTADSLIDSAGAINKVYNLVYVPGGDGLLYALDKQSGRKVWSFSPSEVSNDQHKSGVIVNSFEGNVACSPDGQRVYVGNDNSYFYCLAANTGALLWRFKTNMMIWTVPAFARFGNADVVIFGSLDGYVYILDATSGGLVAKYNTGGEVKASVVAMSEEHIYVANSNGRLTRLALKEGALTASWSAEVNAEIYSSPAVKADIETVIIASMAGELLAFDTTTGSQKWKQDLSDYSTSSPIITRDNIAIIGNSQGRLFAVDASNGTIIGVKLLSHALRRNLNSSPVQYGTGAIVVGSYDGHLHFLSLSHLLNSKDNSSDVEPNKLGTTHVQMVRDGPHIITMRLNAYNPFTSKRIQNAAVLKQSLRIRSEPSALANYSVVVSPDGKFINLIPRSLDTGSTQISRLAINGSYYLQSDSWLLDRLKTHFVSGAFKASLEMPARSFKPTEGECYLSSLRPSDILRWDISKMAAMQPSVLDTYIPAALDGQGMVAFASGFTKNALDPDKRGHFTIVFLPAIPDTSFVPLKEASKVLSMKAEYYCNKIQATSLTPFTFSAMGGTISFSSFTIFAEFDPETKGLITPQFHAVASCLKIRGNGSSYKFSPEIVNQLCNASLDMHIIGTAEAKHNPQLESNADHHTDKSDLYVLFDPNSGYFTTNDQQPSSVCGHLLFRNDGLVSNPQGAVKCKKKDKRMPLMLDEMFVKSPAIQPLINLCCKLGIHPNGITLSSVITTICIPFLHSSPHLYSLVLPLFFYKWFADAIDGPVARQCKRVSRLGGALDSFADLLFTLVWFYLVLVMIFPQQRKLVSCLVAIGVVSIPPLLMTLLHGPAVLWDHGVFKRNHEVSLSAYIAWFIAENSVLVISLMAVAYAYLRATLMS